MVSSRRASSDRSVPVSISKRAATIRPPATAATPFTASVRPTAALSPTPISVSFTR